MIGVVLLAIVLLIYAVAAIWLLMEFLQSCSFCRHGCITCNQYDIVGLMKLMPDGGHVGYQKWAESPAGQEILTKYRELRKRKTGWNNPRVSLGE